MGETVQCGVPVFTKVQLEAARSAHFSTALTILGAEHKKDEEYKPRAKNSVRVLVGYKGRSYRFIFNRSRWTDDSSKSDKPARSGAGCIDFVQYIEDCPFVRAVEICLEAVGLPTLQPPAQLGFPFWPDVVRSLPNEILRSALFTARNKRQPREQFKQTRIAVINDDAMITYTGEELRQNDETVWLQLIQLAKDYQPGQPVVFVAKRFCEAMQWSINKASYDQLRECLTRLQATALSVSSKRLGVGISLSMVPRFEWRDDLTGKSLREWRVTVAPELVRLFSDKRNTWIEWKQRLELPPGIATWLHGYFSSHRAPFPLAYTDIVKGAGLTSTGKDAKDAIRRALKELQEVGFLERFTMLDEHVVVTRQPLAAEASSFADVDT